jgi:hypothetical protein
LNSRYVIIHFLTTLLLGGRFDTLTRPATTLINLQIDKVSLPPVPAATGLGDDIFVACSGNTCVSQSFSESNVIKGALTFGVRDSITVHESLAITSTLIIAEQRRDLHRGFAWMSCTDTVGVPGLVETFHPLVCVGFRSGEDGSGVRCGRGCRHVGREGEEDDEESDQ